MADEKTYTGRIVEAVDAKRSITYSLVHSPSCRGGELCDCVKQNHQEWRSHVIRTAYDAQHEYNRLQSMALDTPEYWYKRLGFWARLRLRVRNWLRYSWVLVFLLLAAPVYAQPSKFGLSEATVIAANAADLGSTIYALHHGAREANPVLGSQLATIAPLKVLGAAAQVLTVRRLKASGHPTAAKITTVFIGSLYLALSVHNVKVGNR